MLAYIIAKSPYVFVANQCPLKLMLPLAYDKLTPSVRRFRDREVRRRGGAPFRRSSENSC